MDTISNWKRALYITALVFFAFVVQHYIRRFGASIADVYFGITFNAIALTGLVLILSSYLMGPLARISPMHFLRYRELRKPFGLIGVVLVCMHAIVALAMLTPAYYPKFFLPQGTFSFLGEISILTGVVGLIIFLIIALTSLPGIAASMTERGWLLVQRSGLVAVVLSIVHFGVFKWQNWITFDSWQNYLPSGTFVVVVFALVVFVIRSIAFIKHTQKAD